MCRTSPALYVYLRRFSFSFDGAICLIFCVLFPSPQFPLSGTFSSDQRIIYEGVLAAQNAVYAMMMPGTAWTDCHRAAEAEIIKALLVAGILQGGSVEELAATGMGAVFFPHGLGHLIGCDTHDVGG